MFPYPSGDLHMGHAEVMALHDVIARYWWQRGHDVLNPMGWDSFGLPAENAAIRNDEHPATYTYANIDTQYESFRNYAISFDWSRRFNTSDPEYYRWTQWLFLKFREQGLAYRKNSPVNWCPNDQTVLANEQVVDGRCERCGAEVTKRELTQWYFKITDYAQRLLDDMVPLEKTWPERVLTAQKNWIGRSEGAHVDFAVAASHYSGDPIRVFTTRPDTLYGATFMVVAADAALAQELVTPEQKPALDAYLEEVRKASDIERLSTDRPKTGVDLGVTATNPVNGEQIPVWAADYVLADYGTGAIMAVPAHDQRDLDFAKVLGLPVRRVVDTGEENPEETYVATNGDGTYVNSGPLDGITDKATGIHTIIEQLERDGVGTGTVNFRLRDWLLSRQRYWGCPIPIIHCETDGEVPVPYDQLPVLLPDLRGADLKPKGVSPLAAATDWVNVDVPHLRWSGEAGHRHDGHLRGLVVVLPALLLAGLHRGSLRRGRRARVVAVRHLRRRRRARRAAPAVRAVLHQGAARHGDGRLRRAVLRPAEPGPGHQPGQEDVEVAGQRRRPGQAAGPVRRRRGAADAGLRGSPGGRHRLGGHVAWRVAAVPAARLAAERRRDLCRRGSPSPRVTSSCAAPRRGRCTSAGELLDDFRFNVMMARVMELVNATRKAIDSGCGPADPAVREAAEAVAIMLSLVAPYTAEEMWARLGHEPTVARAGWPAVDEALLVEQSVTAVVQVQGKVKARLEVSPDIAASDLEALALADPAVVRAIEGREVRRVIVREPSLVNVVV